MRIKVDRCFGDKTYYRLTLPDGSRENVVPVNDHGDWDRATATKALDMLTANYPVKRRSIKFV